MIKQIKSLGPGLLFAGAAIGVSHLVQSTRAGADFGFGLIWALLLINIVKYPFFLYGSTYAQATGESLLEGYLKLGKNYLRAYFVLTLANMFTIQTAVTIVTASLASSLFGLELDLQTWCLIISISCALFLLIGKFKWLNKAMKAIILLLTLCTVIAVIIAYTHTNNPVNLSQTLPRNAIEISFLIAFMGWMPAPLDISIWHSLWETEKQKKQVKKQTSTFDFNVGYGTTILLGLAFIALGALVMHPTGEQFSNSGTVFANQLISLYKKSFDGNFVILISIAAFTTMFSTTLTTLDASPRALEKTSELLGFKKQYLFWMIVLVLGTTGILFFLLTEMGLLIKIATILSFLTAPLFAIANYKLITSPHTPQFAQPKKALIYFSLASIVILITFSLGYLYSLL